jgi:hypothetical protein
MIVDTPYCSAYLSINAIHFIQSSFTVVGSWGRHSSRQRSRQVVPHACFRI